MSKILFFCLLSASTLFSLEFHSYDEALEIQSQNNKIIMIDVIRSDCHYCADMDKNVFEDEKMSSWLNERFIAVKINLDKTPLPLGIQVNFTPSFFFVNSNQEIIKKIPGSWNIKDFQDLTKNIVKD